MKTLWKTMLFTLLFFLWGASAVSAGPNEEIMQQQLGKLDISGIERYWDKLMQDYHGFLPHTDAPSLIKLILSNREDGFKISDILIGLLKFLLHEINVNGKLLGTIILLAIFSTILENFQSSFENSSVSKIASSITFLVLIILAVNSFYLAISYAKAAIQGMMDFMLAIIPILLALLASMGNLASAALFHPFIIFMVNVSGSLIYYVVFPLFFFSTLLDLVSMLSEKYKLTRLAALFKQLGIGILSLFLTVFLGVLSVQGAVSSVSDGLTVRTAKYVTSNFVPVVGKMFSDAADTVVGASLLLKNGIGIFGVIIILLIAAFPALKIISLSLIYKFSSAVLQPLGNSPITTVLGTIGNSLLYIFAALATVCFMLFLSITIIVTAANISIMIR